MKTDPHPTSHRVRLDCAVGTLPALRAAVDSGADWVSFALKNRGQTTFSPASAEREKRGLSPVSAARVLGQADAAAGVRYAHGHGTRVLLTIDTFPLPDAMASWKCAVDAGADLGVDAIALSDPGLMRYAASSYSSLELHLAVTAGATCHEAINFYHEQFGIRRALLPRNFGLAQVEHVAQRTGVELEVHAFGGACTVFEGQCALSSFTTGVSRNTSGICTPTDAVQWEETDDALECRVNGVLVDRYRDSEHALYPVPCGGRYDVAGRTYCTFGEPAAVNAIEQLPALARVGVAAVRLEGLRGYLPHLAEATRAWRNAIDLCYDDPVRFDLAAEVALALKRLSTRSPHALGTAYRAGS